MTQNMTLCDELTFSRYHLGVFLPRGKPFRGKCSGVLCALKASANISTERSSDETQMTYLTINKALQVEREKRKVHGGLLTLASTIAWSSLI